MEIRSLGSPMKTFNVSDLSTQTAEESRMFAPIYCLLIKGIIVIGVWIFPQISLFNPTPLDILRFRAKTITQIKGKWQGE